MDSQDWERMRLLLLLLAAVPLLLIYMAEPGIAQGSEALAQWRAQRAIHAGRSLGDERRYREAAASFEQALAIYRGIGDADGTSVALHSLALCLGHLGEHRRAVAFLEEALAISRSLRRRDYEAADLKALGDAHMALLQWEAALDSLQPALALARETGDLKGEAAALLSLSAVHRWRGDLGRALAHGSEAIQLYARMADFEGLDVANFRMGEQYLVGGDLPRAIESFSAALAAARVSEDSLGESAALYGLGDALLIGGDTDGARKLYSKSLGKLTVHGDEPHRTIAVASRLLDLLLAEGKLDEAAEWIASLGKNPFYQGRLELARGRFAAAEEQLTRALRQTAGVAPWDQELAFRTFRGFAREGLGRFEAALEDFEAAATLLRTARGTGEAGSGFFRPQERGISRLDPLEGAVRAAWRLGRVEQAFRWSEHTKARALTEALARTAAVHYPEPLRARSVALHPDEVLIAYEVMAPCSLAFVVRGGRVRKVVEIAAGREELENQVRYFLETLVNGKGKYPATDALAPGRRLYRLLLEEALAGTAPDDKILVVPDESLGLLPFEALPEGLNGPLPQGIRYVGDRRVLTYWQSATSLSVVRRSSQRIEGDRVLAVADPVFDGTDPRAHRVASEGRGPQPALLRVRREITRAAARHLGRSGFARLPSTSRFVQALSHLYGSRLEAWLGPQASEDALRKADLSPYGAAVVFATHGSVDDHVPYLRQAALVLSNPEALGRWDGEAGDGLLTMSEVMELRMPTEMVAALACSTGLGELVSGEGVMGLGRAFQYAGARSALVSLWNVEDKSTNLFGESVFAALERGEAKDGAVLAARRLLRQRGYEHPYYWAAFILIGERDFAPAPGAEAGAFTPGWIACVAALVVAGGFALYLWHSRSKRSTAHR
jgi:CHAT domain-containing protein/tetratricopeptide (TPR) repeat protein